MPYKDKNSIQAKESASKRNKTYYRKFKEKLLETRRPTRKKYYNDNKEKWKDASKLSTINRRKRLYGVDDDMYNKMLENQDYKCAICGKSHKEVNRGLYVDHCHNTGIVRGLLCDNCNKGIGCLMDSIENLKSAIEYLSS